MERKQEQTTAPADAPTYTYAPAVVTEFGSVTAATLGNKGGNLADDTQYWNGV
ncbi:hypothetical protein [Streptomyces sp. NPDC058989]|uniref:hypothetical protein n=1 Tax=Streptomyces sp. NPDC058989 TaxID=3346686 RepID=UPI0036D0963C